MARILSCYYLDEPLSEEEMVFVRQTLLGPWARFHTGASDLQQKRVPAVLPARDADGGFSETPEQRAHAMRANLRRAGIREDIGRQVVWVMPHDRDWDAVFQFAIREETGFGPFVAQRWAFDNEVVTRISLRIIDTQMLLRGL